MHNWTLFQITKVESDYIRCKLLPYKLIKDCANPMWSWIYIQFKGYPKALEGYKSNWNSI